MSNNNTKQDPTQTPHALGWSAGYGYGASRRPMPKNPFERGSLESRQWFEGQEEGERDIRDEKD